MPILNGKAYWASVVSPNTTFDEDGVYSVDLAVDADNKKKAEAEGLSIKNKGDDRGDFVTIKRKAKRKDGSPNKAPDVMDGMKRPLQNTLIGNGSDVNVLFKTYEWTHKPTGRSGKSADLQAIQVVNLVAYEGGSSTASEFEEIPSASNADNSTSEFAEVPA
jgi:hypothetical protein|tara:strand:+ start:4049 stop:4534 length:486 start_codon:yes stop_codon:yes gene_type:complete